MSDGPMISYAQNFEDVVLARVFAGQPRGFYVDVGAHHPERDSVTRHFHGLGWRGINVEPGAFFREFVRCRPHDVNLNVAVSDRAGSVAFYEGASPGLASMASAVPEAARVQDGTRTARTVPARTLADILAQYATDATIDFLTVDVEGFERQVLAGNDWHRFRPRVAVIEATHPGTREPSHGEWERILLDAGYLFGYFDGLNRFYVRGEDEPLLARLGPPSVFDRFITAETARLRAGNPDVAAAVRELTAERDFLAREVDALQRRVNQLEGLTAGAGRRSLLLSLWFARRLSSMRRRLG